MPCGLKALHKVGLKNNELNELYEFAKLCVLPYIL